MIRTALIAAAMLATIVASAPVAAQTAAPVRALGAPEIRGTAVADAVRKVSAAKPAKREIYVAPAPLGW